MYRGCTALIQTGQETTANLASVFNSRGNAYHNKREYDKAIADSDTAIRLKPDYAVAFRNRGYTNFYAARFSSSASDFERSMRLAEHDAYRVLWLHLARARAGQEDEAEFRKNSAALDLTSWPGPVVVFFLGNSTAEHVNVAVGSGDAKAQREHG